MVELTRRPARALALHKLTAYIIGDVAKIWFVGAGAGWEVFINAQVFGKETGLDELPFVFLSGVHHFARVASAFSVLEVVAEDGSC